MPYTCAGPNVNYPGNDYQVADYYTDSATYYNAEGVACQNAAPNNFGNLLGTIQVAKDVYAISQATKARDGLIRYYGMFSLSIAIFND